MVSHRTLERLFAAVEGELVLSVRWRAGDLDRLMDRTHASLVERVAARLARMGWQVHPEVSFSHFGERGSIDLLAWDPDRRAAVITEVKSEITGVEETLRRHDAKVRLASVIVRERFGVNPRTVSKLLVLPDTTTARRRIAAHPETFGRAYPDRGAAVRRGLRTRDGPVNGVLFEAIPPDARPRRRIRVRVRAAPAQEAA